MDDIIVGSNPLPTNTAQQELVDFIDRLDERYEFKNGSTAAYWALANVLAQHLGSGKK